MSGRESTNWLFLLDGHRVKKSGGFVFFNCTWKLASLSAVTGIHSSEKKARIPDKFAPRIDSQLISFIFIFIESIVRGPFFRLSFRFGAKFITLFKVKATLNRFRLIRREIAAKVALPAGVSTKPQNGSDKNKGILSILEKIFIFMASFFCESRFHLIALSVWLLVFSLTGKLSQ